MPKTQTGTKHKQSNKPKSMGYKKLGLCLGLVFLGLVFFRPQTAWADPHAIFYTAIGQQQLFFNVLAALDQADYVETQFDRQNLERDRARVATEPAFEETQALVEETKVGPGDISPSEAGVSTLLSRLVSLEGADLYTDYLVRLFGAESGRRNSMSELIRTLCEYGMGFEDCEYDTLTTGTGMSVVSKTAAIQARRERAAVLDPLKWEYRPFTDGILAAFSSGTPGDEKERKARMGLTAGGPADPKVDLFPYAYSQTIDAWRQSIAVLPEKDPKKELQTQLLDYLLAKVAQGYVGPDVPFPYKFIGKQGGKAAVQLYGESASDPVPGPAQYDQVAANVLFAPLVVDEIAQSAFDRIAAQQEMIEYNGLLADYTLRNIPPPTPKPVLTISPTPIPEGTRSYSSTIGEVGVLVRNPVAVRDGVVASLPTQLGLLDTSQRASSLQGIDVPGRVQLVDRGAGSSASIPPSPSPTPLGGVGAVQGISSQGQQGLVAGILNLFGRSTGIFDYDKAKPPTSPAANIIAPHLEQGVIHALRILTGGTFRGKNFQDPPTRCGWTC